MSNTNDIVKKLEELNTSSFQFFQINDKNEYVSIEEYVPVSVDEIIVIINRVFSGMILAYEKFGFRHGFLDPKNIFVEKEGEEIKILINVTTSFENNFPMLLNELATFVSLYERCLISKKIFQNDIAPFRTLQLELIKVHNIDELKLLLD